MTICYAAIAAGLIVCAAACASPTPTPTPTPATPTPAANWATLTGEITFAGDAAIPPGAVVDARLYDVSLQDVASVLIASQTIPSPERFPVPFAVRYDPARIDERHTYGMQVSVKVEGELVYVNDTAFHVLTGGYPSMDVAVEVMEVR